MSDPSSYLVATLVELVDIVNFAKWFWLIIAICKVWCVGNAISIYHRQQTLNYSNAIKHFSQHKGIWRKVQIFAVPSNFFIKILNSSRFCIPLLHSNQITFWPTLMVAKFTSQWTNFLVDYILHLLPKMPKSIFNWVCAQLEPATIEHTVKLHHVEARTILTNKDGLDESTLSAPIGSLFIISVFMPFNWSLSPSKLYPIIHWINSTNQDSENTPPKVRSSSIFSNSFINICQ